jgi:superfamily I DNA/RNA helicase/mRNA-degrading endonuclease RelE of RelBE toxin-antitoxin system
MEFRIADTFTDSLARLTVEEQKALKTTAFDLQLKPANPGMSFHKLDKAKDKRFCSVRVGSDIRLIVHKTDASLLLCYVGHHDKAYDWAERRKVETHPKTGAAQLVVIRESVREVFVPVQVQVQSSPLTTPTRSPRAPLLAAASDDELLGYGVPSEWLKDVRDANEDTLLAVAGLLPAEAAEALLDLATGRRPRARQLPASADPFEHPDAQRRFRVMGSVEELERALEFPWDRWTIFLHPEQRQWVERNYTGPVRISGSAGTGKTIVALHRAAHLARTNPEARILLSTFSDTLANALQNRLRRLLGNEPRLAERVDVYSLNAIGNRLYKAHIGQPAIAGRERVRELIEEAARATQGHRFELRFLLTEWDQVVDAWQLDTWDAYRDVARLGRKTRLSEAQRRVLWSIFESVRANLKANHLVTQAELFTALGAAISKQGKALFEFAVVDEAQDLSVAHLRFFAALGKGRPDALFFAGDLGQRIFQQPFSWKALGVDVRGRSRTLRINYRTSHQIRRQADRLLGRSLNDVDGNAEDRSDTISVFNGADPMIQSLMTQEEETRSVGRWIAERSEVGVLPHEIGVFVRSGAELGRARAAVKEAGLAARVLDDHVEITSGHVSIGTMHLAKGLEFRAVAVMACDDEVIPLQSRIEAAAEDSDLEEVYNTERHLLYVACTRARDYLLVTGTDPTSEFLADLQAASTAG